MRFTSVDYQGDFGAAEGKWYMPRPSEKFVLEEMIQALRKQGILISEIISDYRLPRPSETLAYCIPGQLDIYRCCLKTLKPAIAGLSA